MPAVSIITPVYIDIPDKLVWLDEMLQSVLSQTMQNWEVILVDDFSPILIGELKWKYQDEKRFRWFRTGLNSGPAKTRNVAVALAESEAILPLDSDDALASNSALEQMYEMWQADKAKTVYGDLQFIEIKDGQFQRTTTHILHGYEFKNAMILDGVIPVTAMHSVACHNAIGGWKAELEFGREDVEYWLNAGKHGFCGQKINETTLLYRRHDHSRDYKLKQGQYKHDMEQKIRAMHADVFAGRFPVGCCGQSNNNASQGQQQANITSTTSDNRVITRLPEGKYKEGDTWWVEYTGSKRGSFQIFGQNRRESYTIRGTGHIFQIHKDDKLVFAQRSREYRNAEKLEYLRPTPRPAPEPQPQVSSSPQLPQPPAPELAIIERLDRVAMESRGLNLPTVTEEALPLPQVAEVPMPTDTEIVDVGKFLTETKVFNLGDLNLGSFENTLEMDNWTVELLAEAEVGDLTGYSRIGEKRAKAIIDSAKSLINTT